MGKSIEEILKQIESERSQRINEEQSKLDQINHQRDLARKEWENRMRMFESLSNTSTAPIKPPLFKPAGANHSAATLSFAANTAGNNTDGGTVTNLFVLISIVLTQG